MGQMLCTKFTLIWQHCLEGRFLWLPLNFLILFREETQVVTGSTLRRTHVSFVFSLQNCLGSEWRNHIGSKRPEDPWSEPWWRVGGLLARRSGYLWVLPLIRSILESPTFSVRVVNCKTTGHKAWRQQNAMTSVVHWKPLLCQCANENVARRPTTHLPLAQEALSREAPAPPRPRPAVSCLPGGCWDNSQRPSQHLPLHSPSHADYCAGFAGLESIMSTIETLFLHQTHFWEGKEKSF